jgi:4-carboxymuconolactone decarboxylase
MARVTMPTDMTTEQKKVADAIMKMIGTTTISGPYSAWIHRPELAHRLQSVSEYFRKESVIPPRLRLLAVLITVRHWTAAYPWSVQVPGAIEAGLAPAIVAAIAEGKTPDFKDLDEGYVYEFATELLRGGVVSEATYRQAHDRLGQGVMTELVGVIGHFTTVSLTVNAFDIGATRPVSPEMRKR